MTVRGVEYVSRMDTIRGSPGYCLIPKNRQGWDLLAPTPPEPGSASEVAAEASGRLPGDPQTLPDRQTARTSAFILKTQPHGVKGSAYVILTDHQESLVNIAERLLEREVIQGDELEEMLKEELAALKVESGPK